MRWLSYLGARHGIALALALLIVGLVVSTKLLAPDAAPTAASPDSRAHSAAPATSGEPRWEGDDVEPSRSPAQPSTAPGAAPPEVVAKTFAQAWLRHTGVTTAQWLAGLQPHATAELLAKLKGTDPARVPADRLTGEPSPGNFAGQSFVEYHLVVDSGNLTLRLVAERGQWRVDTIDWERAR